MTSHVIGVWGAGAGGSEADAHQFEYTHTNATRTTRSRRRGVGMNRSETNRALSNSRNFNLAVVLLVDEYQYCTSLIPTRLPRSTGSTTHQNDSAKRLSTQREGNCMDAFRLIFRLIRASWRQLRQSTTLRVESLETRASSREARCQTLRTSTSSQTRSLSRDTVRIPNVNVYII